jgi:hypothetical protein
MADLEVEDTIHHDRETVFKTFRDHLTELIDYLPDIRSIEEKDRERIDDHTLKTVKLWKASEREVPGLVQKFIKPEMLQWHDHATWHEDDWTCEWRMEVGFLEDAIDCHGVNRYIEEGDDRMRIEIDGTLDVDASEIPGVPGLVAGKVGNTVESFVLKVIEPNLSDVNRGLERYLDDQ